MKFIEIHKEEKNQVCNYYYNINEIKQIVRRSGENITIEFYDGKRFCFPDHYAPDIYYFLKQKNSDIKMDQYLLELDVKET